MLTAQDICSILSKKEYPENEYWVIAGAGLVLHGVKTHTRDIDINCSTLLADMLIAQGARWELRPDGMRRIEAMDDIEIYESLHAEEIVKIDGICVASLDCIRS